MTLSNLPIYAQPMVREKVSDLVVPLGFVEKQKRDRQFDSFFGNVSSRVEWLLWEDTPVIAQRIFDILASFNHNSLYHLYNIAENRPINDLELLSGGNMGALCFEFIPQLVDRLSKLGIEAYVLSDSPQNFDFSYHVAIVARINWVWTLLDPTISITRAIPEGQTISDFVKWSGKQIIAFTRWKGEIDWGLDVEISDGPKAQSIQKRFIQQSSEDIYKDQLESYITTLLLRDNAKIFRFNRDDLFWRRYEYRIDFTDWEEAIIMGGDKITSPHHNTIRAFCRHLDIPYGVFKEMRSGVKAGYRKLIQAIQ